MKNTISSPSYFLVGLREKIAMPRMRLLCGLSSTQNDSYFIYDNYNVLKYISSLPNLLMVIIVVCQAFYPIRVYLTG